MVIIALLALLLALYPSIGFVFFRLVLLERMESVTLEDFNKYRAGRDSDYPSEDKLRRVFRESFSVGVFLVPVLFLTLLYAFAFLMITAVYGYWADSLLMFPERFLLAIQPVLLAFVGVYVFNMGHSLRRLYLYDLTENVFWGAVYRTLLSLALRPHLFCLLLLHRLCHEPFLPRPP